MSLNLENAKSEAIITQKNWLSPSELEAEYGFSKSWQAKARMKNSACPIPFTKIGGKHILYHRVEIEKWLEENKMNGGAL